MTHEERKELWQQLEAARAKMVVACQHGSKKAWRRYGKIVYRLEQQLGLQHKQWMEDYFGKRI
jgi:hypothetical protein